MARLKPKRISITQFTKRYSTETACKDYLAHARWPEGFVCPACGSQKHCVLSNGLYQCGECHHQTSVTAGTFQICLTDWQSLWLHLPWLSQMDNQIPKCLQNARGLPLR